MELRLRRSKTKNKNNENKVDISFSQIHWNFVNTSLISPMNLLMRSFATFQSLDKESQPTLPIPRSNCLPFATSFAFARAERKGKGRGGRRSFVQGPVSGPRACHGPRLARVARVAACNCSLFPQLVAAGCLPARNSNSQKLRANLENGERDRTDRHRRLWNPLSLLSIIRDNTGCSKNCVPNF